MQIRGRSGWYLVSRLHSARYEPSWKRKDQYLKPKVGRYYPLPKALITIEGAPDTNDNLLIDASVSFVADSSFRYFLRWRPNVFSEDIFNNIDVDSDGMLTSINYSAEDKTPQILSDLVTTTVNIAKIGKDLGAGLDTGAVKYPPFTYTFDPFDAAETNKVKSQLSTRQNIELQISPWPSGARSQIGRYINGRVAYHTRAEDPPPAEGYSITRRQPSKCS